MSGKTNSAEFEADAGIIPIRIRPDRVVRIASIPHDLTTSEAEKIGRVVRALASREGQDG